ncbi:hypothetical protein D3C80_1773620 [compost metagenome]
MTVALALAMLALQQAVQRSGQAQQLPRVLVGQAGAPARLDLIQLHAEPAQATKAPGQAEPQKPQ